MGTDLDPLDDIFSEEGVQIAKPKKKFQPKVKSKFQPAKQDSAAPSVSSMRPSQAIETTAAADISDPVKTVNPSENLISGPDHVFSGNESGCASVEKSAPEVNVMGLDLDPPDDIFAEEGVKNAPSMGKFQPKVKDSTALPVSSMPPSQTIETIVAGSDPVETTRPSEILISGPDLVFSGNESGSAPIEKSLPEVNTTAINLDPLDDIFSEEAVKNAQPMRKFQPKAKTRFQPTRKDSAGETVCSMQSSQTTATTVAAELCDPIKAVKPFENLISGPDLLFNGNESGCASMEKSVPENVDIFHGLEALEDMLPNNDTLMVSEGAAPSSECPNPKKAGVHVLPFPASVKDANNRCKKDDVPACPELSDGLDPLTAGESIVSITDAFGQLHEEEMYIMDSLHMSELTAKFEQKRGKFQPKPKIQTLQREIGEANEPVSSSPGSQCVEPETNYAGVPQQDDMLDLSDLGFTPSLPMEVTSEVPLTEASVNQMEMTQMDTGIHPIVAPEIPAKLASRRANSGRTKAQCASALSPQNKEAFTSGEGNEMRRSLRPRKNTGNLCELVDEADEEVLTGGEISDEIPINAAVEDEYVDEESQLENESHNKKIKRKPKRSLNGKEKSAGKRKKAEEVTDKGPVSKPKRFPHSTRRRRVDKALLETPEDEIDCRNIPLRDLILLAEHKERQMKKDNTTGATTTNQSSSRQNGEQDEQDPEMVDTTVYFNYQSHMDRTPATRWSKQETELFYEGLRQFGTDLSMIQQLFPERSRRQVKLKYKKEERQQPLRLREALSNRSKDCSHFQWVIENLKKKAAEESQNADYDDPIDLTANEGDEETLNVDKEETKEEQIEEEEKEDAAKDLETQRPTNVDYEDEDEDWSNIFR
ncbi:uncharacterized protein LOC127259731 isoform X2 [Andrographis paniculata]|uniref:uncharacterized protein LOC127259731 isoform X2 n=1 Tax=Andrographis paniculata TaxID=175694 RepID=UPI0021E8B6A1|nr:uncharacterized protein LOC127259731 isoform X2 [Andrographis paniculata]